ncbi:hypothetical protein GCM10010399_94910 [Dactylosporangium fulvum]|uniref:Integral membrane protein n=1 Tax=Dactylosporangium fulvum TaxID=53359 RepID=A0ABY5WC73_9ACTN|nr:hypothetical protein [Dactylosporangium fulvum]UWP87054.1 hypothetical protein Dfulv_23545 [Dactylosporangium fulvum]
MTTPRPTVPGRAWHVPDEDLARYAARTLVAPASWSVETHLTACAGCRGRLTALAGPALVDEGWARIDAELDAPVPGPVERLLMAVGVPDHTARLLAATPALRLSWLAAVALTLAMTAVTAGLAGPLVFLAVAPLLPLAGVAASFGPGIDPTHEITVVAPFHAFRLLMLRCVAVLSINTVLCAAASLTLPDLGARAAGWFLPSLVLTVAALLLSPRLGPVVAASTVGAAWAVLVAATAGALFTAGGQASLAGAVVLAAAVLTRRASAFDTARPLPRANTIRRFR